MRRTGYLKTIGLLALLCGAGYGLASCRDDDPFASLSSSPAPAPEEEAGEAAGRDSVETMERHITIRVGGAEFAATLEDNETARAFAALLPMTVTMTEMNGNEKYYNLPQRLPGKASRPGTIHAGDLLLWSGSTVVLFYETFSSPYSYCRIGRIDNPEGLASAVGRGGVTVTFEAAAQ